MVVRKQKKVTRYRGSKTHGGGSMKKRRGAGHRGGRGRAGSGKRGDAKKPSYWRLQQVRGFTSRDPATRTLNVGHLSSMIARLAADGKASEKDGSYTVDLHALGVEKLLGTGIVNHKIVVTVPVASEKAVEKLEAAGGSVSTRNE